MHWDGEPWLAQVSLWVRSQAGVCSQGLTVRQLVCEAGLEEDGSAFVLFCFPRRERFPVVRLREQEEEKGRRKGVSPCCGSLPSMQGPIHGVPAHSNLCRLHLNVCWHQLIIMRCVWA